MYDHYVAGDRRRDHPALRVPDPVHAVPARGLAGRAAGDVRVPDRDLGAHRAAGRQRLAVRGPVLGRLGRLPGARRHQAPPPRRLARRCTRTPRDARTYARGFGAEVVEVGLDGRGHRRRASSRPRSTTTPPRSSSRTRTSSARSRTSRRWRAAAHEAGRAAASPRSTRSTLGVLRPPGECGVDVAVGEGQPLGSRLDFGGPSFGFFCATEEHLRRMPGRIAGETTDADGRRGFVLALQTREQHIRREKATHNICTSQALNALGGMIYLAWLGKRGIVELGELLVRRTAYARERLAGGRRRRAAPRRAGGARVRGPASTRRSPGVLDRVRRGGDRRRLPARAATTPSTRTACWSRSPSGARGQDIDRLADVARARGLGRRRVPAIAEKAPAAAARSRHEHDRRRPRRRPPPTPRPRSSGSPRRTIFERSVAGPPRRRRCRRSTCPRRPLDELIPQALLRAAPPELPEVSEPEIVRHYNRLSRRNFDLDTGPYPLGSCTMKHNPRLNERVAALPGPRPPASRPGPEARPGRAGADVAAGAGAVARSAACRTSASSPRPARTASSPACCSPAPTTRTAASSAPGADPRHRARDQPGDR